MNEQRVLSLDVLRGISVSGFVLGLGLLVLGLHGVPAVPGSQAGFSGAEAVPGGWGASAVVLEWAATFVAGPLVPLFWLTLGVAAGSAVRVRGRRGAWSVASAAVGAVLLVVGFLSAEAVAGALPTGTLTSVLVLGPGLLVVGTGLGLADVPRRTERSSGAPVVVTCLALILFLLSVYVFTAVPMYRVQTDATLAAGLSLLLAATYACAVLVLLLTPWRIALGAVFAPLGRTAWAGALVTGVAVGFVGASLEPMVSAVSPGPAAQFGGSAGIDAVPTIGLAIVNGWIAFGLVHWTVATLWLRSRRVPRSEGRLLDGASQAVPVAN
ncbi:hypothetical protein [Brevibacterium samyangense]|uniref:Cytochrome c oxidase assembly protein n=1 Tax=Brevibacterium samyangense TaxID=366888 RepID=A0ABP5EZM7_9MICO